MSINRRKPDLHIETYALGHNEVMQIALALRLAREVMSNVPFNEEDYVHLDPSAVGSLEHIFAVGHGVVSVTRENEDDGSDTEPDDRREAEDLIIGECIAPPCPRCGWQVYSKDRLIAAARGEVTLDPQPTHFCTPTREDIERFN